MDKVFPINVDEIPLSLKGYGEYNDPPPNLTPVDTVLLGQSTFFTYGVDYIEYRQVDPKRLPEGIWGGGHDGKAFLSLHLFYSWDGSGIAMHSERDGITPARFFTFYKCAHHWVEKSQAWARANGMYHGGNCYHVYECESCGMRKATDSSG